MIINLEEDNNFEGFNKDSTNQEVIDVILKRLYKSKQPEYIFDWKINFLSDKRMVSILEDMLEAKVVIVKDIVIGKRSNYCIKITQQGEKIIEENGGWLKYKNLEKRENLLKLIIQTGEKILLDIYDNGYITIFEDIDQSFKAIDRLFAEGLIYESQKSVYKLTKEGIKVVETGGFKEWLSKKSGVENFLNVKPYNTEMNPSLRLELTRKIAIKLSTYTLKQINSLLADYNFTEGLKDLVTSRKLYVEEILSNSNSDLLILKIAKDLEIYDSTKKAIMEPTQIQASLKANKIFLSHSTADSPIVDIFLDFLGDIGVKDEQIFYSSKPWTGVDIGEDFLDRIKNEINENTIVISFLSENFYNSPISLCEMGAAWVKTEKTLAILIPPFNYSDIKGVIRQTKIHPKLDKTFRITEVKEYLEKELELIPINSTKWERKREKLLREFASILKLD